MDRNHVEECTLAFKGRAVHPMALWRSVTFLPKQRLFYLSESINLSVDLCVRHLA
jgi:hypothetical protein